MLLWLLCHRNAISYMCPQAIITSQSHDTRESPPLLVDPENTTYSHRPLGASSHVPPGQVSCQFGNPAWSLLHALETLSKVSELHSDMNYPLVPRDILGYYSTHYQFIRTSFRYELPSRTERHSWVLLHPLSVRQNSIPTWTTLWYRVIFLGITPPIICLSELHSDMNCAPSYIFCWIECLITILTVLIWTIWEPQGSPRSFI